MDKKHHQPKNSRYIICRCHSVDFSDHLVFLRNPPPPKKKTTNLCCMNQETRRAKGATAQTASGGVTSSVNLRQKDRTEGCQRSTLIIDRFCSLKYSQSITATTEHLIEPWRWKRRLFFIFIPNFRFGRGCLVISAAEPPQPANEERNQ